MEQKKFFFPWQCDWKWQLSIFFFYDPACTTKITMINYTSVQTMFGDVAIFACVNGEIICNHVCMYHQAKMWFSNMIRAVFSVQIDEEKTYNMFWLPVCLNMVITDVQIETICLDFLHQ